MKPVMMEILKMEMDAMGIVEPKNTMFVWENLVIVQEPYILKLNM